MDKPHMPQPQPPPPGFAPVPGYGPAPGYAPPPGYAPTPGPMPPPPYHDGSQPPPQQPSIVIVGSPMFGSEPQRMTCPHCHAEISTNVEAEANSKTHLFALLLCIVGLWCCAPCPYCMDSCMVKKHYCPSCRAYLGQSDN